jgi:DNA-binding transcriptional MerR regulator
MLPIASWIRTKNKQRRIFMADTRYRLPNETATHLEVSPSTLRRWSNEFSDFLSDAAGRPQPSAGSQTAHRRYTDQDLETLLTIKGLLAEGLTYMQVGRRLEALRLRQTMADAGPDDEPDVVTTLGPSLRDSPAYAPAVTVLSDTLHTVADGQQLLLGSQQANRELLTVVLQDNFNLKEENAKLRDRMLELERDLAELRRQDAGRHDTLNARLQELETRLHRASSPSSRSARPERPGCLGQIFS